MSNNFYKYQAAGNDFILIDLQECSQYLSYIDAPFCEPAIKFCNRHYGIGSDGLIFINRINSTSVKMIFFNPDGTRDVCGNGMRSVAQHFCEKSNLLEGDIITDASTHHFQITRQNLEKVLVKVQMPIPFKIINFQVPDKDGLKFFDIDYVDIGTSHAVLILGSFSDDIVNNLGSYLEKHKIFPDSVTVNFVVINDKSNLQIRFWERGVGETLACGTGSCSSVWALRLRGLVDDEVIVHAFGGDLSVNYEADMIMLESESSRVFSGSYNVTTD